MSSFVNVFGDYTVPPSGMAYSAVALVENSELLWPELSKIELPTQFFATSILEVNPTLDALTLKLPRTSVVSLGKDFLVRNVGAFTLQILNSSDASVTSIEPGVGKYLFAKDADTNAWGVLTYGAGASGAEAAELAGAGLNTANNELQLFSRYISVNSPRVVDFIADRFKTLDVVTAGITLSLGDAAFAVAGGFITLIRNSSDGQTTIASTAGQSIDGNVSKVLYPRESCILLQATNGWVTVGYGRDIEFSFSEVVVDVTAGDLSLSSADLAGKMIRVIGTPTADREISLPAVNNIYFANVTASVGIYSVGFKVGATSPVILSANQSTALYVDGIRVYTGVTTTLTSNLNLLDGSAAAPTLKFLSEPNTGLFHPGPGLLGVAVGGVESARFNVGGLIALQDHEADLDNPHVVTKAQVGLGNADNTADVDKPISTLTQTALDLKAPLASPVLTGNPTAPTGVFNTSSTQIATTAFVQAAVDAVGVDTERFSYVAVGGETTVTVPFATFQESEVFLNGIHQNELTGAYSVSGPVFTFPAPLLADDQLYFLLGRALELTGYTSLHTQAFVASAGQTLFVLTGGALTSQVMVFVNGIKQADSTYTLNVNDLTFSEGWNEGDAVEVLAFDKVQHETLNVGPILLQRNVISSDTLVPEGFNGLSVNPTITPGTTITVAPTSTWAIVGD